MSRAASALATALDTPRSAKVDSCIWCSLQPRRTCAGAMWWGEIRLTPTARCAFRSKNLSERRRRALTSPYQQTGRTDTLGAISQALQQHAAGPTPDDIQPTANE